MLFEETAKPDNSALLSKLLEHLPTGGDRRIADVGCGSGRDLKAMQAAGWNAIGIEAAPRVAALAGQVSGVTVIAKSLNNVTAIPPHSLAPARFVIEPGRRLDSENSSQCRRFTQTRIAPDGAHRFPGVACRSAGGRWRLVDLEGTPKLVILANP